MLPLSPAYFAFAAVAILLYWLCYRWTSARLLILVAANFFFLARFAWFYPIILLAAATIDFRIGLELQELPRRPDFARRRKQLVTLSLLVNIGLLAATKLLPSAYDQLYHWVLPLSLSFYCFQSLTYTIDLYRGTNPGTRNYLEHLTAATLFSVVVAGPINRVADLIKQLRQPFSLTKTDGGRALLLIASGLLKKLLIADFLSENVVNRVFDTPTLYSGAEVLFGVYCYALQIYFDFSGYTDIAMGVSQLLGLQIPDNFNRPYWSVSIADFWKRWHITFSNWLRDYLYYSLPNAARWKEAFGLEAREHEVVASQKTEAVLIPIGDSNVELIAPRGNDGLARFLEKRGPGLHHIAIEVEGIEGALALLKGLGVPLIDEAPRSGARGHKVAFVHPKATGGVLVELVEPAH